MMKKCWDVNPLKRPTILELSDFADDKLKEIYENKDSETSFNENNNSSDSSNSQQIHKSHPLAYHTSRILEDDIAKFKNLKINTNNGNIPNAGFNKGELNHNSINNLLY